MATKNKIKKYGSLFLLIAIYVLCSLRYFPGRLGYTLLNTLEHIASIGLYTIGATILIASILQRMIGERLAWEAVIRIFLGLSILLELFLGISHYVSPQ